MNLKSMKSSQLLEQKSFDNGRSSRTMNRIKCWKRQDSVDFLCYEKDNATLQLFMLNRLFRLLNHNRRACRSRL